MNNSNYKDGKHCEPQYCECGAERDYRAERCRACAGLKVELDIDQAILAVSQNTSYVAVARALNVSRQTVRRFVELFNLDVSHFAWYGNPLRKGDRKRYQTVKRYVLLNDLLPYVCVKCNQNDSWNGSELTLDLDHIDGDPTNNVLENLRFLCPNCHSQTPTYKGRNSRRDTK